MFPSEIFLILHRKKKMLNSIQMIGLKSQMHVSRECCTNARQPRVLYKYTSAEYVYDSHINIEFLKDV